MQNVENEAFNVLRGHPKSSAT